jgi:hypothetical protein
MERKTRKTKCDGFLAPEDYQLRRKQIGVVTVSVSSCSSLFFFRLFYAQEPKGHTTSSSALAAPTPPWCSQDPEGKLQQANSLLVVVRLQRLN